MTFPAPRFARILPGVITLALAASAPSPVLAKPPRPPRDAAAAARAEVDLDTLIRWLLAEDREHGMVKLPFASVVFATTGHRILPLSKADPTDAAVLKKLSLALDESLRRMNAPDSPARGVKRINEASHFFENTIREVLDAMPELHCEFAPNARGQVQRSGYPDLHLVETASGRSYYLDPKLYESSSRRSSFRTFYFEPRRDTNKVLVDACHLVVGIAHNGERGERARFLSWELIDCSELSVQLKAEFQASNHDLYREAAVLATGKAEAAPDSAAAPSGN